MSIKIVGILLAAGTSSRFNCDVPKQLYCIDKIPIIEYSLNAMLNNVDKLLVVINKTISLTYKNKLLTYKNSIVIENNINERKSSLNTAIAYIQSNFENVEKVVIHDAARPLVTSLYFQELLKQNAKYVQYALKLTNGLYNIETNTPANRDSYIEPCTPICISADLLKRQETDEILNSIDILPHFLFGTYAILRKITTLDDVLFSSNKPNLFIFK